MPNAPRASRPHSPGYGIVAEDQGEGLLPWSWAEERLAASRNYFVATVRPDGRPHVMVVWGVWLDAGRAPRSTGSSRADILARREDSPCQSATSSSAFSW